jgi:hypothetical protein
MTITLIKGCSYYPDGGTIELGFACSEGLDHHLELVERTSSDPSEAKQKGDIVLDEKIVTREIKTLQALCDAIGEFRKNDKRQEQRQPMPKNTFALGGDFNALLTTDQVGQEKILLMWAEQRITRKIQQLEEPNDGR